MSTRPQIIWVFGTASDIGKTAVATALLRVLARHGYRTLPFKPLSAADLFINIDAFEERPAGVVSDADSEQLIQASSALVGQDPATLNEVVNPQRVVFFHTDTEWVMARSGAPALGNETLYRGRGSARAWLRPEIRDLLERKQLWDRLQDLPDPRMPINAVHQAWPQKTRESWEHLMGFSPDVVVCEGGSRYLPTWPGQPAPDQVLMVHPGRLEWLDILSPRLAQLGDEPRLASIREMSAMGSGLAARRHACIWPALTTAQLAEETDGIIEGLLKQAGHLAP